MSAEILLGPVEFALWQMMTRILAVSTVTQITYLTVFANRPGFQIAAILDVIATVRSLVRFIHQSRHGHPCMSRGYDYGRVSRRAVFTFGLLLLALLATILDYGIDIAFSAYQRDRQLTIVWVRPTNASRRISVPSVQFAMPVHRRTTNALLQSVIQDELLAAGDKAWVRSLGTLTEAEIMAMQFSDRCGDVLPSDSTGNDSNSTSRSADKGSGWPSAITGKGTVGLNMESLSSQRVFVHGMHQRLYPIEIYDDVDNVVMAVPIPQPYEGGARARISGTGNGGNRRDDEDNTPSKQFGATAFGAYISSYRMSCGLSPAQVDKWLHDHSTTASGRQFSVASDLGRSFIPGSMLSSASAPSSRNSSTRVTSLHYLDYNFANPTSANSSSGNVGAVFVHLDPDRAANGEYQLLAFGSISTTTNGTMASPLVTISEAVAAAQQLDPRRRLVMQMALDTVTQTCSKLTASENQFQILNGGGIALSSATGGPLESIEATIPNRADVVHCRLTMVGLASMRIADKDVPPSAATPMRESLQYLSGAQVCKITIRTRRSPDPLDSSILTQQGDYVAVARVVHQHNEHRLRCLDPAVLEPTVEPQQQGRVEPRPAFALAFLSRMFDDFRNSTSDEFAGQWIKNRRVVSKLGEFVADGHLFSSWQDSDGSQQYSAPAVRVEVYELMSSMVLLLATLVFSVINIPTLFDTVMTQLFLFPALRNTTGEMGPVSKSPDSHPAVAMVEDLTFSATLVLIEYPAGMDPKLAVESEPGTRPRTMFDVQLVHADQSEVQTPFGPIPLDPAGSHVEADGSRDRDYPEPTHLTRIDALDAQPILASSATLALHLLDSRSVSRTKTTFSGPKVMGESSVDDVVVPLGTPWTFRHRVGTYRVKGDQCARVVKQAVRMGYRLIDTAQVYRNEDMVGAAIAELIADGTVCRQDLFVTTKIAPNKQGAGKAYDSILGSRAALQVETIDLVLIHWPGAAKLKPDSPENPRLRRETWQDLERAVRDGLVRYIGVSNYTAAHLRELLSYCTIRPATLQMELHPAYQPADVLDLCEKTGIFVQAYSSLGEGHLLEENAWPMPAVQGAADKRGVTRAQVLLAWARHRGWGTVPKSTREERLADNLASGLIKLTEEEVLGINALACNFKFCWDPSVVR
ncbi:hypothetical protein GGF31_002908 [Allomyces arbusculus]|nr:hypothetical protein GGF31_002908 [Allomyces arbusculus]